ncbi:M50 family metallopeptidase, partial [Acinetobacter baumannii]
LWQRAIIIAAGPLTNLLIAFLILAGFAMVYGKPPSTLVGQVEPKSVAARADIRTNDRILAIDGHEVGDFYDVFTFVQAH